MEETKPVLPSGQENNSVWRPLLTNNYFKGWDDNATFALWSRDDFFFDGGGLPAWDTRETLTLDIQQTMVNSALGTNGMSKAIIQSS